ncbi:hypothetical protein, partial [Paludifilum halophilum]
MEDTEEQRIQPWWTIWYQTRRTIRRIMDDPRNKILVPTWVSLFGISFTLDQISFSEYGDWYSLSYLLLISLPIG